VALAAVVVIVLARSLTPPENASSLGSGSSLDASRRASAPARPEISGTISIARDLTGRIQDGSVLFVIARKAAGPPFAVKRIVSPQFPVTYRIGPEDVMMAGSPFEGEVHMSARLSRTGTAGPPEAGDLEGEHPAPVAVGSRNVDILISRVR
jgi:cytochrome c-type biogenesis protein CcmH